MLKQVENEDLKLTHTLTHSHFPALPHSHTHTLTHSHTHTLTHSHTHTRTHSHDVDLKVMGLELRMLRKELRVSGLEFRVRSHVERRCSNL